MSKTHFILLALLLASALATVASTHRSRKLFIALENGQTEQKRIDVEWGQLQLEQSTWAKHALVEGIASRQLGMRTPDAARTQYVMPAPAPAAQAAAQVAASAAAPAPAGTAAATPAPAGSAAAAPGVTAAAARTPFATPAAAAATPIPGAAP